MYFNVLTEIKTAARDMTCGSFVYDWRLRGHTPERLLIKPVDVWPGSAEKGAWLYEGSFALGEDRLNLSGECWEPMGVDAAWTAHMHGFTWVRDLRAYGGEPARNGAREMIRSWIRHYPRWHKTTWRPDIAGDRICSWIAHYDFFGSGADEVFQDEFFDSLIKQARHLRRALPGELYGVGLLKAIQGLLYAGVAFEGYETWIENALDMLKVETAKQILPDGSHISRSPAQLMESVRILIDAKMALSAAGYPLPEWVQHAIDRAGPALRFFRYGDKHFAVMHGTQEGDAALIDAVLAQASAGGKALSSLPSSGFERVTQGRSLLLFDTGKSPPWPHDASAHAAPLSFEMSYGKERIFVSCGSHPASAEWQDALRATAAHNTLTMDSRNACEIGSSGHFQRRVRVASAHREETKNACLLEATHDGYIPLNGMTHRRRLYMTDQGHDLRGEDILGAGSAPAKPVEIAIRFHIHPRVLVSMVQDGSAVLLRLPTGVGWRFSQCGGRIALEDSIYMGTGTRPRKTRQIVIYGNIAADHAKIKWALQREGLQVNKG